jgi:hypothetical protein
MRGVFGGSALGAACDGVDHALGIKNIKYTPEGEDVALVLPTVMKNMLQGAVDDMIEGKVREQVEKLVKAAIATAAKLFKKTVPGIPTLGNDADDDADDGLAEDTAEDDEVEAAEGEGGAKGEGTEVDAEGRPITLEEGIERYDEEDAQIGVGTAAIALAAGGGAALALGVSAKDEDGDANPTVQVLDEATIGMVLYSVSCLEPILKAYTKRAHVEQREWFGHTGKDELKAFNKTEKKKKKKERGKVKYQMPVHTFQEIGKETALFAPFLYIKCIILPRQARDKHRENSKKEWHFLRSDGGLGAHEEEDEEVRRRDEKDGRCA